MRIVLDSCTVHKGKLIFEYYNISSQVDVAIMDDDQQSICSITVNIDELIAAVKGLKELHESY